MRVLSEREFWRLWEEDPVEAWRRLREAEWVMDDSAMFTPSEEFARFLENSGSVLISSNRVRPRRVRA
ncbi:protein of unknown function [Thermococcus nautili]|uniref:hypothetical protein n=1 Tax=Thermococcus nautili TaxID=195522 RepID=UPI002552DD8E|nr:hypothetical protein [Thermococcus nautili]CAI1492035.1 protein of unknown function [Thermococcus nautili]